MPEWSIYGKTRILQSQLATDDLQRKIITGSYITFHQQWVRNISKWRVINMKLQWLQPVVLIQNMSQI